MMRKILKWIGISLGATLGTLSVIGICVYYIGGLIVNPFEGLKSLLFAGVFGAYFATIFYLYKYCSKCSSIDWQKYELLKRLNIGIFLLCGLMLFPIFSFIATVVICLGISYGGVIDIIELTISSILLTSFLCYTYVRFVKARNNALFLVRSCLSLLIVGLIRVIYSSIGGRVDTLTEITSLSFGYFIAMQFILMMVLALSIKGLMITFGNEANKVFPKSQRTIPFHDILIVLLLVLYLVMINVMDFTW